MGDSSNSLSSASARIQDLDYLPASNTNVSNFVSVKLSGNHNYRLWKAQMIICLLDSNNMRGIVDGSFVLPRDYGSETMKQYESLAKGWIFGSISEDVLEDVFNLDLAKDVWEELKCAYGPSETNRSLHKETIEETEDIEADTGTTETKGKNVSRIVVVNVMQRLRAVTVKWDWSEAESILKNNVDTPLDCDDSTILHFAVERGRNDFVKKLVSYINEDQVLRYRSTDGSAALHIAATVGNKQISSSMIQRSKGLQKQAAELLLKKNSKLLGFKDHNGKTPLDKAYENMHLDTIVCLLNFSQDSNLPGSVYRPNVEIGVSLLVNAIVAKQYNFAFELVKNFQNFVLAREDAMVAMAKSFPSGLEDWETLIYPSSPKVVSKMLRVAFKSFALGFAWPAVELSKVIFKKKQYGYTDYILFIPTVLLKLLASTFMFICLFILIICWVFIGTHYIGWKGAKILAFPPVKHIENKKKEWDDAKWLLELICDLLKHCEPNHHYFTRSILEAACHNAYEVVNQILHSSPKAIQSKDKNGYDIIQLAIINRSEKIYNLIYDLGERKNVYRTCKDSSENNIMHLAGKLAPSSVLSRRTGAALQLQRELQWLQEVEKFVFPSFITQENISNETPYMVFSREHKDLVKEGEEWMKTTAESCSITAALIITIVFAAAITVPGGNQENGTPLLKNQAAFIIFAIADAISLFASSTSLLVFLSILTTRFAEKDFLFSLPRRLFIGLFTLLLSTTTMMVAFSATLFLVFCDQKLWMLAPICGLAFIPIAFFVTLQFPLMVDLFKSTYLPIFGKQRQNLLTISIDTIIEKLDGR